MDLIRRHAPNTIVLIGLAALGYAGHRTGWTVPRLADLRRGSLTPKEDWCEAHHVPDSRCLACHPELGGNDPKDWCKEHGVPESKCTVCHPEILTKGKASDWCQEHGVPESGCTICHPDIAVKGKAPEGNGVATAVIESGFAPAKDPTACQTHVVRIQFPSPEAVRKAGVQLAAVTERPIAGTVVANAEVGYDQTRIARLSARVPGTVVAVTKDLGAPVARGDVLALVDAADVGKAKADLLQGLAALDLRTQTLTRVKTLADSKIRSEAEVQQADAALAEARAHVFTAHQALLNLGLTVDLEALTKVPFERLPDEVRFLGIPEAVVKSLDERVTTANLLPIRAPLDGELVARDVVPGEVVDAVKSLFVVADVTHLQVNADARLEDSAQLALGQKVLFRVDGGPEPGVRGTVTWISPAVDERTRTVRVRAVVENAERRLRANTFGMARIVVRESPNAVVVPNEAIQFEGCCHVVFVRLTDDIFQTRKVRLGARSGGFTEVLAGVSSGEVVTAAGSPVLKAELLKSKLGAGCCD